MKKLLISVMSVLLIVSSTACSRKSEKEIAREKAAEVVKETEDLLSDITHTSGELAKETIPEDNEIVTAAFDLVKAILKNADNITSDVTKEINRSNNVEDIKKSTETIASVNELLKTILSDLKKMQKEAKDGNDISEEALEIINETSSEIDINKEEFQKLFAEAWSYMDEVKKEIDFSELPSEFSSEEIQDVLNQMQEQLEKYSKK